MHAVELFSCQAVLVKPYPSGFNIINISTENKNFKSEK
jgi:hypothetical protein